MQNVENSLCFLVIISTVLGTNSNIPENAPFLDNRDGTVTDTFTHKPLGVICSELTSCVNTGSISEACVKDGGTTVLISCHASPWRDAVLYCQSHGGHIINQDKLTPSIKFEATTLKKCRKFWLSPSAQSVSHQTTRSITITSVTVSIVISTDDPLTVTLPATELTTTSSGKSTLAIVIAVPLGLLFVVLVLIVIGLVVYFRKKKGKKRADQPESEPLKEQVSPNQTGLHRSQELQGEQENEHKTPLEMTSIPTQLNHIDECENKGAVTTLPISESLYSERKVRLATFRKWEYKDIQLPEELARAGFYSIGEEDKVRCFCCDVGVNKWEKSDQPWYIHHKMAAFCEYLQACKSLPDVAEVMKKGIEQDNETDDTGDQERSQLNTQSSQLCMRCFKNSLSSILRPCYHSCVCWDCSNKIVECIICTKTVATRSKCSFKEENVLKP